MILAGDIGGTKTLLGLFARHRDVKRPLRRETFPSQEYDALEAIIAEFLAAGGERPAAASLAVAGPVRQGKAQVTNLPWVIAAETIGRTFHLSAVHLMNDVQATAAAVPFLAQADLATLRAGEPDPTGAMAVIAPGTGLGEAFLTWDGRRYQAHPSEGGHASFAPGSEAEVALLAHLHPRFGHLSFERVCSGSGIPNLYDFLSETGRFSVPGWLREALDEAGDPTPVIVDAALERRADICVSALDLFVRILGREVGNMALKVLSSGGIYLGGGMPPRILSRLQQPDFLEAISAKGRFRKLLDAMPVHVILDAKVALHGAAFEGLAHLGT